MSIKQEDALVNSTEGLAKSVAVLPETNMSGATRRHGFWAWYA